MNRKTHSTHSNRALTRALHSMKQDNEDNEITEIHPLILVAGVLVALFLVLWMLRSTGGEPKLAGVNET